MCIILKLERIYAEHLGMNPKRFEVQKKRFFIISFRVYINFTYIYGTKLKE